MFPASSHLGLVMCAGFFLGGPSVVHAEGDDSQEVHRIEAGPNLQYELQARLIDAVPGEVIELGEGIFRFHCELNVACDNLTIRGQGLGKTVLSFKGQQVGSEGLVATGNGFVIEDLAVEDTAGDAIKVLGANGVVFRRVRAEWTNGPSTENGAYGIYPVECRNVLVEDCVAIGASDAGIYVGQSRDVIVRRCRAEYNVAGIEIENTVNADVYECVATNNTGGLLVFDLPGLPAGNGGGVRLFRNTIHANNTPNFAPPGNIVGTVPAGTGIMVMAMDNVEIFDNDIHDNGTANVSVVSYLITERKFKDPNYDPFPEGVSIHGNRMSGGGEDPAGKFGILFAQVLTMPLPDILYDGLIDQRKMVDGEMPPELGLRIDGNGDARFANFDAAHLSMEDLLKGRHAPSYDPSPHAGRFAALPAAELAPLPDPAEGSSVAVEVYRSVPRTLAGWELFEGDAAQHVPAAGVHRYELNTPLFSDYSTKHRFIKLPDGTTMNYREHDVLEFPTGTVISKTFAYPRDMRDDEKGEHLLETRIEVLGEDGWHGFSYQWNDDQTDAYLVLGGASVDASWIDLDGDTVENRYEIPNANQCLSCHEQKGLFQPLGPTAANLNGSFDHGHGEVNQLRDWVQRGMLAHAPNHNEIPQMPTWDDADSGELDARARAWLDVNCAHCHNPLGTARTSGLDLGVAQRNPAKYGVMKSPVAAGRGSGGRGYDIVPGKPEESILLYRMESEEPSIRMPSLGRSMAHPESIELIREWIASMPEDILDQQE
ncbi:MAG: right-handed parallel beta-helix repeat-containing protein [Phycisphaerales bacterium]|nr:right-handed parallel beta-helix repeat-containing protein [Phycisphaerales bacterium]